MTIRASLPLPLDETYFLSNFFLTGVKMTENRIGSVMVVGGGIAGMQTSLDLANSGYYVYLVERSSSIGGVMSQLDKTFPTNDCSM
jgi:heterodisulfide reductase subunit A-like polyferredoxin